MSQFPTAYPVVLIGMGRVARKHLKALHHYDDRFRLVGVVDTEPAAARSRLKLEGFTAEPEGDIMIRTSLSEMLTDLPEPPTVVAICTPSGTHYALAMEALEAGCHVLIEKPMTLDLEEGRRILELAGETGLKVALGHIYRFFPVVDQIRRSLRSGEWGRIYQAEVKVHWGHDQAYYDLSPWRGTWASDGGVLMNQTVHALDLMMWMLDLNPVSVSGAIARLAHDIEAEDYGSAIFTMEHDVMLLVEGTTNTSPDAQSANFRVVTEAGSLEAGFKNGRPYFRLRDRHDRKVRAGYLKGLWRQLKEPPGILQRLRDYLNPHGGIYRDLSEAIRDDRPPRADAYAGYHAVESILGIYFSAAKGGCPVSFPLKEGRLTDMQGHFDET